MGIDAPGAAQAACNNACTMNGDAWECNLAAFCGANSAIAYAVSNFNGTGEDYSAWGSCGALGFCCAHTEQVGTPVNSVVLLGTSMSDHLYFNDPNTGSNLQPANTHNLLGFQYGWSNGGEPDEVLTGSDYQGGDYRDNLYGEDGGDFIHGLGDFDFIDGGPGNDEIWGGGGNDRIVGGLDSDILHGEAGNDTLCESTATTAGGNTCAIGQVLEGDGGTDALWHDDHTNGGACIAANLNGMLSGGGGGANDKCGDSKDWGLLPWFSCEINITAEPAECADPN
jgi:hypothetical protein